MSYKGILSRGKINYDKKRDLNNSETLAYIATLKKEVPKIIPIIKPKEIKKNDRSNK